MNPKIVCVIQGGVLQGVYSDWYSSLGTDVVLVDYDCIKYGAEEPTPEVLNIIEKGNQLF